MAESGFNNNTINSSLDRRPQNEESADEIVAIQQQPVNDQFGTAINYGATTEGHENHHPYVHYQPTAATQNRISLEGAPLNDGIGAPNDLASQAEFCVRKQRIMRSAIVILFTFVMTGAALGGAFLVADPIECIEDRIFDMTASLNNFFATHQSSKFTFMIICGLMMDIMVLTQFYRFAMFGSSWRFLICIACFYVFRFFCQQLFYFRYPDGYLWEFPGFYSITVPYGKTNDFFFSGHVGCCIINFLEFRANGWGRLAWFSIITCVFQITLMVCLRGHYFIDLISGVIFAHYAWMIAERYSYIVDVKIFRIPFRKRFPLFTHSCTKCQHPVKLWAEPHNLVNQPHSHFETELSPGRNLGNEQLDLTANGVGLYGRAASGDKENQKSPYLFTNEGTRGAGAY